MSQDQEVYDATQKCMYCEGDVRQPREGLYRCENCGAEFATPEYIHSQFAGMKIVANEKPVKEYIPDSLRWAVWERDNFTCQDCGSRQYLTIDHIFPESLGGKITMENAQTLCRSCNSSKGAR